jgi:predicted MFS family arabinose efflux permease
LAGASFLIFFQSYLFAPLIPSLKVAFGTTDARVGLLVPAYMLAYAVTTLVYGPLSDRVGRRPVLLMLLAATAAATVGTATARTIDQLLIWRLLAGVAAGGIIPIALALLGDLYPYAERGRAIGWIFGGIAGGMAFGSTAGALLNPVIGWRWLMVVLGAASAGIFVLTWIHRGVLVDARSEKTSASLVEIVRGYWGLARDRRGGRAYFYIALNGMFHSGVFTWLGLYFSRRYGLGDEGIGVALLGYGVPGMLLGPTIGRWADRVGRRAIIPAGLVVAAVAGGALALHLPMVFAALAVTVLSVGYDMSHPLLAGIITSIDPARRGQAMALNAFVLFVGFGVGPLLFEGLLTWGFGAALLVFSVALLAAGAAGVRVFREEFGGRGEIQSGGVVNSE